MQNHTPIASFGAVLAVLAKVSRRPRYAFLVLQLVAEAADQRGRAGPWIENEGQAVLVRDWLCRQLMPVSEQTGRRAALRERVMAQLGAKLSGEADQDQRLIEAAVAEQALAVGRANVSRAISELTRAGLLRRYYAGFATDHPNRGGGRHAVYELEPCIMRLFGRAETVPAVNRWSRVGQGDLFAA